MICRCCSGVIVSSVSTPPTSTPVCATVSLVDDHFVGLIGSRHASAQHAVGGDTRAEHVVYRGADRDVPNRRQASPQIQDQFADGLDLWQVSDPVDGRLVVAVVTRGAGARCVDDDAVVVRVGRLTQPVEAARGTTRAGECGDGDGEADAGDQRQRHQREVPPAPVGTHPHADRAAHPGIPRSTRRSVAGIDLESNRANRRRRVVLAPLLAGRRRRAQASQTTSSRSGLRNTVPAASGRGRGRVETQPGKQVGGGHDRGVCLEAGEMHAEADVRSLGEREVLFGVAAADVEAVRFVEEGGIAVGGGDHHDHEIAPRDVSVAQSCVRVAKRSTRTTDG